MATTTSTRTVPTTGGWAWVRAQLRITDPTPVFLGRVVLLEMVVVAGTMAGLSRGSHRLSPVSVALLVVIGSAMVFARRWPLSAIAASVAALLAYQALGNPTDGPMPVGVIVALYIGAIPGRPWRSVVIAAAVAAAFTSVAFATHPTSGLAPLVGGGLFVLLALPVKHTRGYLQARPERRTELLREEETQRRLNEERLRIARELHDVVSHTISLINVQAGVAAHVMDDRPEQARDALLAIKATSKEALRELRAILGVLRQVDDAEPRSPAPGLSQLTPLVEATRRAGLETLVRTTGEALALAPAVDLAAYRIVQEALTNALRHAGPAKAVVNIAYSPTALRIEVRDDGGGTDAAGRSHVIGSGTGIEGMRERAASVGGELEAGPGLGRGFTVTASLPLDGSTR